MTIAKLFVPFGAADHWSPGETSPPWHVCRAGISCPSVNPEEVSRRAMAALPSRSSPSCVQSSEAADTRTMTAEDEGCAIRRKYAIITAYQMDRDPSKGAAVRTGPPHGQRVLGRKLSTR